VNPLTAGREGRRPRLTPAALDLAVAGLVVILGLISALFVPQAEGTMPAWLAIVSALCMGALVAVRRRWPIPVLVAVAGVLLVGQAFGTSLDFGGFALLIAVYTVATEMPRRTSLVVLAALPAYLVVAVLVFDSAHPSPASTVVANLVTAIAIYATAWLLGDSLRKRRMRTAALEARAERLERDQAEAARVAVQNERAVMARELHDVIAHNVSVMIIQAAAARRVIDDDPAEARAALESIEATGREAFVEMRRLLGLLRSDDGPAPLAPQPGLANLGQLIANARSAGVVAELSIAGDPRPLAPGIDLAAYRIVQEAITNTIKHAAPTRATIRLTYGPAEIVVDIRDLGGRAAAAPIGVGHGLVGMEERVRIYGGEFRAGPSPEGGFAIHARIPTGDPA
jgi:signal transduction histidine kinase